MKKYVFIFLLAGMILGLFACSELCEGTSAPAIELGVKVGIEATFNYDDGPAVSTEHKTGQKLKVNLYKYHCSGTLSGPFDYNYTSTNLGTMVRDGVSYWSFKMDNTKDFIAVNLVFEGKDVIKKNISYDEAKTYDNDTYYIQLYANLTIDHNGKLVNVDGSY